MSRIHPSLRKNDSDDDDDDANEELAECEYPSVWTVWKKSSMTFEGTDGFSIYDSEGRLAFRVDNYSRKNKCFAGEILLMDGKGKAVMALRPQILSMHDRWSGFKCGNDLEANRRRHVFSMRRRSILQGCSQAEVLMGANPEQNSPPVVSYRTEGCFRRRSCRIVGRSGEDVARISRKKVSNCDRSVTLGEDVLSLVIQPHMDAELVMAILVVMDRIC